MLESFYNVILLIQNPNEQIFSIPPPTVAHLPLLKYVPPLPPLASLDPSGTVMAALPVALKSSYVPSVAGHEAFLFHVI